LGQGAEAVSYGVFKSMGKKFKRGFFKRGAHIDSGRVQSAKFAPWFVARKRGRTHHWSTGPQRYLQVNSEAGEIRDGRGRSWGNGRLSSARPLGNS